MDVEPTQAEIREMQLYEIGQLQREIIQLRHEGVPTNVEHKLASAESELRAAYELLEMS